MKRRFHRSRKSFEKLEVRYSCPQWLIKTLLEQYDEPSTLAMLEHSLDRPPLYVRVNTTKISVEDCIAHLEAEGVQVQKDPDLQGCLLLSGTASIEKLTAFSEGLFHVQDKSSQLCAAALDAKEGQRVLDTCSAPGSKSFTTAERMGDSGEVISCDIFEEKIKRFLKEQNGWDLTAFRQSFRMVRFSARIWANLTGYCVMRPAPESVL